MNKAVYCRLAVFCIISLVLVYVLFSVTRLPQYKALTLLLTALPLSVPIRGTLQGSRYTIGYSALLSTGYFCLSGWLFIIYNDWIKWLMLAAMLLALLWFFACLMHNKGYKKTLKK